MIGETLTKTGGAPLGRTGFVKIKSEPGNLPVIAYRAMLDLPRQLVQYLGRLLCAALTLTHVEHGKNA